tara:strand:+ start:1470 stop:2525 length:1056 start_codon:yes stop_codon:yes gene_type:complete
MSKPNKQCVGIIFGGKSNEHQVSIKSAQAIYNALNSKKNKKNFSTKVFYINKDGQWSHSTESLKVLKGSPNIENFNNNHPNKNFKIFNHIDFEDVDIWFPIIHGANGEDGTIQGFLKLLQKPFVGSGILGSALGMDKIAMKLIFSHFKIPQVNHLIIQNKDLKKKSNILKIINEIESKLNFPVFVKPANSGSSIGISKVMNKGDIFNAIQKAFEIDDRIIIEEGLDVRELEVGIIGNRELKASEIGEVNYSSDWYDYDSKYKTKNEIKIPASIDQNLRKKIQTLSIESCKILNINIFARADFFLEKKTNRIFLNEINTIPGFTENSMFPMLWKASGLEIDELVAKIIQYCL